jgi:hypothetical protein
MTASHFWDWVRRRHFGFSCGLGTESAEGSGIGALGRYPDAYELLERIAAPLGERPRRFGEGFVRGGEEGVFKAWNALETPDGDGESVDQLFLVRVGGLAAIAPFGQRCGELGGVLIGEQRVGRTEAVEGVVAGGDVLALGGAGTGAAQGIAAVGLDLTLAWHRAPRSQGKPGGGGE